MTAVATLGVFDGFHPGHAAVVSRARARARVASATLVVFTFDQHPRMVLAAEGEPPPPVLTLLPEKIALLRGAGADEVRVLRFNRRLAAKGPRRFLREHLFAFHRVAALVVGYDFAMGRGREGSIPVLRQAGRELGFTVEAVGPEMLGGEAVSSTRIRRALGEGRVEEAAGLLGRPYRLEGTVERGEARGRGLGYPTANLAVPEGKHRPARGVYAVDVEGAGNGPFRGVVNLGRRPTFGGRAETTEVHILGFSGDLVGRRLSLTFLSRIREERKFKNGNELADQIRRDVERARKLPLADADKGP